jgi:hypothetical protein
MTRDQIRAIFLANGFTVKEGQTDLKEYVYDAAAALLAPMHAQIDALLAHCPDGECPTCASIVCPHKCDMHFHHDGCPACAEHEASHD